MKRAKPTVSDRSDTHFDVIARDVRRVFPRTVARTMLERHLLAAKLAAVAVASPKQRKITGHFPLVLGASMASNEVVRAFGTLIAESWPTGASVPTIAVPKGKHALVLTGDELHLLVEALDSHAYWQLSDDKYRRDGFVDEPGSDDKAIARAIRQTNALHDRLEQLDLGRSRTVKEKAAIRASVRRVTKARAR